MFLQRNIIVCVYYAIFTVWLLSPKSSSEEKPALLQNWARRTAGRVLSLVASLQPPEKVKIPDDDRLTHHDIIQDAHIASHVGIHFCLCTFLIL